ncbi:PAS domain S-box protein [Telluribacter sp. SYSU D00476]|uniref:PAS domain S-box protein n=1 Tax=Telluribacter sp. SYSU D00476 TaxID=2811430 RepID=UPI001FF69262|nr:PAS domain S-box protein [Telluribacter sp. SYSU D00476]
MCPLKLDPLTWRWFKVRDRAFLRAEDGTVLQTIGIVQDIQDRKEALDKLREEHLRFRNAEVLGTIGSFERILPGNTLVCSDEFYRIHGLEPQSQVFDMEKMLSFVHPEDQKGMREQLWATHTHDKPLDLFQRIIRSDGAVRIVHVRADVVKDERGKPVKVYGTIQDFTELKQAQEEAGKNKSLMEAVFNGSLSEMMVLLAVRNDRGEIIDFEYRLLNHTAHTMAGQDLVGKRYLELNPQDRASGLFDLYRRVVETGEAADLERFYIGSGFRNWFRITAVKLDDGVVLTVEDITKRKQAEEENQQATKLLRDIFEGIQVQISYLKPLYDEQGNLEDFLIILTNDEDLRQQSPKKIQSLSRKFSELFPGYRQHELWDMLVETYLTGRSKRFETWYGLDDLDLWIDVSIVKHESGLIYSSQIINDRKRAEEALTKTLSIFQRAEQVGALGSYEADLDTMTFHFSDNLYRLFGQEPSAFVPTLDYIDARSHPDDVPVVRNILEEAILNRQPYTYTRRIYLPDGQLRYLHAQGIVVTDQDDRLVKLLGTIQDITERVKAEDELRSSEENSRNLLNVLQNAPDAYLVLTPDFTIRMASDAFLEATLSTREGIIGKYIFDAFPDNPATPEANSVKNLRASLERVLKTRKPHRMALQHYDVPRPAERGGGFEEKYWSPINTPVLNSAGEVVYIIHRVMDVTEVVKRQGVIQDLTRQTEALATALNEIKEQSAELAVNKQLLQAVLDSSFYFVQAFEAVRNESGKIIDFTWIFTNHIWNKHYGDMTGKSLLQQNPAVIETGSFDKFVEVTETGITIDHEHYYSHEQFHEQWFHQTLVKMGDGFVMNTEDITERKKNEQEILRLKDEAAQRTEDKYKALFNSINEGISVLELIYDNTGKPSDMLCLETNPALEEITGLKDVAGKLCSEFVPTEQHWLDAYDAVVKTGEPIRIENYHAGMNRWYRTYTSRVGGPGSRVIANVFEDITEPKRREQQQAFLLKFSDTLRTLSGKETIENTSIRLISEFFGLDRSYIATVNKSEDRAVIGAEYNPNGLPSLVGDYRLSDFPESVRQIEEGTLVIENADTDTTLSDLDKVSFAAIKLAAVVSCCLRQGERNVIWSFAPASSTPRSWTKDEVRLIEEVAERTWTAIERAKAEEAILKSEEKYRSLFNSVDEGFEVIEIICNEANEPIDFRFLETNPAFEQQTGLKNVVGKLASEVAPNMEAYWLEAYDKVAKTGEPIRQEEYNADTQGWYSFYCFRVGSENNRLVAILFNNITERKQRQLQRDYLLKLNDALRLIADPLEIQRVAMQVLGEHLNVDRVLYAGIDGEDFVIHDNYVRDDLGKLVGRFPVAAYGSAVEILQRGETVIIKDVNLGGYADTEKENYAALNVYAVVSVPLIKNRHFVANLTVHQEKPRHWRDDEIALIQETAERTWAAVERAKAEEALHKSEEKYRTLFNSIDEGFSVVEMMFDENGKAVDYIFRELNPTHEKLTGLPANIIGMRISELMPNLEEEVLERYGKAMLTGEPARYEQYISALDRWFEVYTVRVGGSESRLVANVFNNITERKQREQQQTFLIKLGDALRFETDPFEVQSRAARVLGEHLGAGRVAYAEIEADDRHFIVHRDYTHGVPSFAGRYPVDSYGREFFVELRAGRFVTITDAEQDTWLSEAEKVAYAAGMVRAAIAVPLIKGGRLTVVFFVHFPVPHKWTDNEVLMVEETAERTWAAVERAKAEVALRESEQRLANIRPLTLLSQTEDLASIGSWEYNRLTREFSWSEGMYKLFGLKKGQPVWPDIYLDYAHESDLPRAHQLVTFLDRGEGRFETDLRIRVEGQIKTLRIKADVVNEGQQMRVMGVDLDISEQLAAQQQIQQTALNLQAVLDGSPAAIGLLKAIRDPADAGRIIDFQLVVGNRKLAQFLKKSLKQLIGNSVERFSRLLWGKDTLDTLRKVRLTDTPHYEERQLRPDGRWSALALTRQDDGVLITALDITDLKMIQEKQQSWLAEVESSRQSVEALDELHKSLSHRSELLRAVSHDLRGNFGVITGALQLLSMADTEAERAEMMDMVLRNIRQATSLLTDLLDFSRLEAGKERRTIEPFDVSILLEELAQSLQPAATEQGLLLTSKGPTNLTVEGDRLHVYRMVQNLAINAIKYTHQGSVQIEWNANQTHWWFSISDTGPGLDAELVAGLNDRKSYLKPAEHYEEGKLAETHAPVAPRQNPVNDPGTAISWNRLRGEGIGLQIVRQLARLLDARLEVSSQLGVGTRFVVRFPLRNEE